MLDQFSRGERRERMIAIETMKMQVHCNQKGGKDYTKLEAKNNIFQRN